MKRRTVLSMMAAGVLAAASGAAFPRMQAGAAAAEITVYKDANCGCCSRWISHLRDAGFMVTAHDAIDLGRIKAALGVPEDLHSCHTATVDGYVVEGHVPAADIKRLLSERPEGRGVAVPGMPIGSPGMEQGAMREPYDVLLFETDGDRSVFASH